MSSTSVVGKILNLMRQYCRAYLKESLALLQDMALDRKSPRLPGS